jgi:predicted PurR-regulated permease PerM
MTLIDVLTVVVLILVSALIVFLIVYLGKITRSIQDLQKDISDLSDRLEPLVSSLSDLTSKLSDLSDHAKRQLEATKGIVFSVRDRVEKILEFEEKIRDGINGPISGFLNQLRAISNGVSTFLSYLKK